MLATYKKFKTTACSFLLLFDPTLFFCFIFQSYYECVELGVGQPVSEDNQSIVQTTAEVYSRSSLYHEPPSEGIQNDLMNQMTSGSGYAVGGDSRRSTISGRRSPVSARARSVRNSLNSRHQRRSTGSTRMRSAKTKRSQTPNQHKSPHRSRNCSTRSRNAEQTSRNDMQLLLADSSRARSSQGVMTAHAERLRAAESRRTSRQIPASSQ